MSEWLYPSGSLKLRQVVLAANKLYALPRVDIRHNCDARMAAWLDESQKGLASWDVSKRPPLGVTAYHDGSWRDAQTGNVTLTAPDDLDARLAADKALTLAERAVLSEATNVAVPGEIEVIR